VSLKLIWATERVQGQPGLHSKTLPLGGKKSIHICCNMVELENIMLGENRNKRPHIIWFHLYEIPKKDK
jgi:hypothetical protein